MNNKRRLIHRAQANVTDSRMNNELSAYDAISLFARVLGWPKPRECVHVRPDGQRIVWYESAIGQGTKMQINCRPPHAVAVLVPKYRIHTGFRRINILREENQIRHEARRLSCILLRFWFDTPQSIRTYLLLNPLCSLDSKTLNRLR